MAEYQKQHLELLRQQRKTERDKTLKIDYKLVKVGHAGEGKVPFEMMKFERQLQEHKVDTWEDWYQYLLSSVSERLKSWIESRQTRSPAKELVADARGPSTTTLAWKLVYLQSRWEILIWCRADLFKPADEAEKLWKSIRIDAKQTDDAKEMYKKLEELEDARQWMVLTCGFVDTLESLEREMKGLEEKIPKGTGLYQFVYTNVFPQNFDQWSNMIRDYARTRPQDTPLLIKVNVARPKAEAGGTRQHDSAPRQQQQGSEIAVRRYGNDSRLAATGGGGARKAPSGGGPGRNSDQPYAGQEALKHVPKCSECGGRHLAGPPNRCKPNEYARSRGYRQSGTRACDYTTHPFKVACRGQGHERRDHIRYMQEFHARRQAASRFQPNRSKGKGKGKGGGKGKSKGKRSPAPRPSGPNRMVYRTGKFRTKKVVRTRRMDVQGNPLPDEEQEVEEEIFEEFDLAADAEEAEGLLADIDAEIEWDDPPESAEGRSEEVGVEVSHADEWDESAEVEEEEEALEEELGYEDEQEEEWEPQDADQVDSYEVSGARAVLVGERNFGDFPEDVWEDEALPMTWPTQSVRSSVYRPERR